MNPPLLAVFSLAVLSGTTLGFDAQNDMPRPIPSAGVQLPHGTQAHKERTVARSEQVSVARLWNEELLAAVRRDQPRPPVVTRYLYHVSAAMYDAWAAYDSGATAVYRSEIATAEDVEAARREAISYAAYRIMQDRFANSPGAAITLPSMDDLMNLLGYDPSITTVKGSSPAAVGNRIAASVLAQTSTDGSNQDGNYADTTGYAPVNGPLVVAEPGSSGMVDINRWQPLIVPEALLEQGFLAPHWGEVTPFAMKRPSPGAMYIDPGTPPLLGGEGDATFRADLVEVIRASGQLDPTDGTMINISPGVVGNNTLGQQDGTGHPVNPTTGQPYDDVMVLRGDWGRVLAEFWADGPLSSTPPGHWNEIANEVSEYEGFERRFGGTGPELDPLEWDVKLYLALNSAVHDTAIATWEVKAHYDFGRPLTFIRAMGQLGQSSDPDGPGYHPNGLPLEDGLSELITADSSAPGERHEHLADFIGEVALFAWNGHPADPLKEFGGSGWIRAAEWLPYQARTFVTPPFAGYTSGHSGFSRASAEVMTLITGDAYFPGGQGTFVASSGPDGFSLGFEFGPDADVALTWATYYDAADEAGISRIYGGIHPALDDFPGRILGAQAGIGAFELALRHFNGEVGPAGCPSDVDFNGQTDLKDLNLVLANFGQETSVGDANGDGVVDLADLNLVLANFGTDCP